MTPTKYETEGRIRYSGRLHERHARLYGRARNFINFLNLLSGTTAFVMFFGGETLIGAFGSAVVVGLGLLDQVYDYSGRAAAHRIAKRAYLALLPTMSSQDDESLDAAYRTVVMETDIDEIESLRIPSQNDVLLEMGHTDLIAETRLNKLYRAIA